VVLLATLGERQTIRYVLEEVAESIHILEASKYQFSVLIIDDSRDPEFNAHVESVFNDLGLNGRGLALFNGSLWAVAGDDLINLSTINGGLIESSTAISGALGGVIGGVAMLVAMAAEPLRRFRPDRGGAVWQWPASLRGHTRPG
jgi:hypothetical protein